MMIEQVNDLGDPRLALYRNLKDRELAAAGNLFMAESLLVVQRLLRSPYPCQSVLCAARKVEAIRHDVRPDVPVYVVPDPLLHEIVGYKFHTGVLAIGRRLPGRPLEELVARTGAGRATFVVLPDSNNVENIGSIARIAAAFGVSGMILGEECADPFYRQAVRVSMGTVFSLPLHRSADLKGDLVRLRDECGVELAATVLAPDAEPLAAATRPQRFALLFGSEGYGLSPEYVSLCGRRVTIPMSLGTDSLNVSIAAAVFLYHFTQLAKG